jgi:hypothetical protein
LVANGTTHEQRILRGTLATLAHIAARRQPQSPALLIVGEVAGLSESLRWFHPERAAATDLRSAPGGYEDRAEDAPTACFGRVGAASDLPAAQVE